MNSIETFRFETLNERLFSRNFVLKNTEFFSTGFRKIRFKISYR